jgi:hypothetical protein
MNNTHFIDYVITSFGLTRFNGPLIIFSDGAKSPSLKGSETKF